MPSMTFLDGSGDTTISWSDDVDADMRAAIRRLMDRGYSFFVVDSLHGGKVEVSRKVTALDQLTRRSVVVQDEALSEMFEGGRIRVEAARPSGEVGTVRAARTVDEVSSNDTVAVRPMQGG